MYGDDLNMSGSDSNMFGGNFNMFGDYRYMFVGNPNVFRRVGDQSQHFW